MNKVLVVLFCAGWFFSQSYYGSTTAPVVLAGAIVKAKYVDVTTKKYKRQDCPVCKGKGWYISGDQIKKVDCGYCEPDEGSSGLISAPPPPSKSCDGDKCTIPQSSPKRTHNGQR